MIELFTIKLFLFLLIFTDLIKFSLNFLFSNFQAHLPCFTFILRPLIIYSSPSPNLIKEKGILHKIKEIKKINSFSKSV